MSLVTPDQAPLSHAGGIWVTAGSDSFQSHNLCLKSDKVDQAKWDRTLLPPSLSQLIVNVSMCMGQYMCV